MLAAEFSAAGIPALANEQPYVYFNGTEEAGDFSFTLSCNSAEGIANFSMQITYDPAVLRYVSYEVNSALDNALVSVSANNGTLTLAFVSTSNLYFDYRELITLRFDLLNPEPTYTEIHCAVLECTDMMLNSKSVSCDEYLGYWVKNDATTNYELSLWNDYNVPLFSDTSARLSFNKNGGFYAGSLTVTYDPAQMEFAGCKFKQENLGMTLNFTDVGDETAGRINIAFAGTQLYSSIGDFLEIIFVPKATDWCWYNVENLVLTNGNLQDVCFDGGFGNSIYCCDTSAENYFSLTNAATVAAGNTFDVVIDLNNNAGFAALTGALVYDSDLFEFVSAELNSDTISGALSSVTGVTPGEVRFAVVSTSPITSNGELLTVTLRAIAEREEISNLELKITELVDLIGIPLPYAVDVGNITVTASHSHTWAETGVVAPTCTEDGYTTYTCSICGSSYNDHFQSALGHSLIYHNGQAPSCTKSGWEAYETCGNCAYTTYVEILATGHSYNGVVTAPTCTEDGYTTHTCTVCGDWYVSDYVDATGHHTGSAVIENEVPASCTTNGSYDSVVYCTDCAAEISRDTVVIPASGHNHEAVVTAPTCTQQGYTTYTCHCGDSYVSDHVAATGHSYVDGTCKNCGQEEPVGLLGDVNMDGRINARDARALLRYIAGLINADDIDVTVADYNGDGRINARDARALLRHIAGLD